MEQQFPPKLKSRNARAVSQIKDKIDKRVALKRSSSLKLPVKEAHVANSTVSLSLPAVDNGDDDITWKKQSESIRILQIKSIQETRRRDMHSRYALQPRSGNLCVDPLISELRQRYNDLLCVIEKVNMQFNNPNESDKLNPEYLFERAERMYSSCLRKIVEDLKRVHNGKSISLLVDAVWKSYIKMFDCFVQLRNKEKCESKKKITKLEKEVLSLKERVEQFEKQKLQRKVRAEAKIKAKVRHHLSKQKIAERSVSTGVLQDLTVEKDEEEVDSDIEKPYEFIGKSMKLLQTAKGSGADKQLSFLYKDLLQQTRTEFVPHDWAGQMLSEELFGE